MQEIIKEIEDELERAETIYPDYPFDLIHRVAIMIEEAGETMRAALNHEYHGDSLDLVREEAVQTAAMCIRLIDSIDNEPGY
jgi:malate synthase